MTFAIAFAVLFLSMFGALTVRLCEDNRQRFYGPLDGSVHVTDQDLNPVLTYDAAAAMAEDADVITGVSAVKEYVGVLPEVEYVGFGSFTRDRFAGEDVPFGEEANYVKGYQVVGVTSMEILEEVYNGDLTMTEGTMITEENNAAHHNKIVISEELAQANGLSLGDTVSLSMLSLYASEYNTVAYGYGNEKDAFVYIVGGIYRHRTDNFAGVSEPWLLNANHVYVPITTLVDAANSERIQERYHSGIPGTADVFEENPCVIPDALYFHLSDRDAVQTLADEINQIGFRDTVLLTEYVSDAASSPSARLSEIVSILLAGVIGVGAAVFFFSVLFNMKARHRELAVLVALGKKRSAVASSFSLELLLLTAAALLAAGGIFAGLVSLCAGPLTSYLYSAELSAKFRGESADLFLFGDPTGESAAVRMEDFGFLFGEYAVPSFLFALAAGALILAVLYFFIGAYVRRINALSGVGGKE